MAQKKKVKSTASSNLEPVLRHWREAVPEDRLAHLVKDAWRAYVRALQTRLTEHAVSFGHWTILRVLWEQDGLTQRELSARAGVMEPTTHSALRAMTKLGYVRRQQAADNKKNVYIFLTRKGRALKRKLVPLAKEVNDTAVAGISKKSVDTTRNTLLSIIENLAQDEVNADVNRRMPSTRELGRLIANAANGGRAKKKAPRKKRST